MDDTTPGGAGPAGVPGMAPPPGSGGPVADRMQALLSRAVEEQVSEQRQVSGALGDLRAKIDDLSEQLQGLASGDRVEQLASDLGSMTTELRRSSSGTGERLDVVARRVDEQSAAAAEAAAAGSAGTEALAVRLGALGDDVAAQGASLDRVNAALGALSSFPDALGALQGEIAGLHDRLTVLSDLRNGLADLTTRTSTLEGIRPELAAVAEKVDTLATSAEVIGSRDSVVVSLGERLDRLEQAADRPVLSAQALDTALADVRENAVAAAAGAPVLARLDVVEQRFADLDDRLDELGSRLSEVRASAGGVPAVASDLALVAGRLDRLAPLHEEVAALGTALDELRDDSATPALVLGVSSLREDVEDLGSRVDGLQVPSADAVAQAVSSRVGDRIVDALAPRVADVVLTRVAAVLVEQVAGTVTASVQNGLTEKVRAATAESERRMSAHVDEAILALAEALLRRRRPKAQVPSGAPAPLVEAGDGRTASDGAADQAPVGLASGDGAPGDPAAEQAPEPSVLVAPDQDAEEQAAEQQGPEAATDEAATDEVAADEAGAEPVVLAVADVAEPAVDRTVDLDPVDEQAEAELQGREQPGAALEDDATADHAGAADAVSGAEPSAGESGADLGTEDDDTGTAEVQDPAGGPGEVDHSAAEDDDTADDTGAEATDSADETDVDTTDTDATGTDADEAGTGTGTDDPAAEAAGTAAADTDDVAATGRDGTQDDTAADDTAPAAVADDTAPAADPDGSDASERTGALALRSGLRGLGLEVDDPVRPAGEGVAPAPSRPAARTAPPARPRLVEPTPDLDDDVSEPVPSASPVQPRADVRERFATASNAFGSGSPVGEHEADDEEGPRRRPWWRPGG